MTAFDSSFRAAIPGSSIAHKWGSFPFSRPPKYTKPEDALEFFWNLLHKKENLKQIWHLLEKGATAWAITRSLLYKASMEGLIQLNLAILIGPTVGKMVVALGHGKGIDVKMNPPFRSPTKENMSNDTLNSLLGNKHGKIVPKSALTVMTLPKANEISNDAEKFKQLQASQSPAMLGNGLLSNASQEQQGT